MPYLFTCPHCQTRTEVEDEFSGQTGECVVCGRQIQLPDFAPQSGNAEGVNAGRSVGSHGGSTPKRKRSVAWVVAAVMMLLIVGAAVIAIAQVGGSAAQRVRQGRERMASIRNLEKIALALNAYAADHGTYPAPAILGQGGKPLLSWRVQILPYLGEEELFDRFNLNERWDSEENQMLSYQDMPAVYRHSSSQGWATDTVYHLVTGTGTLFPASGPLGPKQVLDGAGKTILCVEARKASNWTEPVDVDAITAGGKINSTGGSDLGGVTEGGVCVVTVDGRGHFLAESTPAMTVNALVSPKGGEPLTDDVLD
ncbi:DUF1559 family PulG-like putative transporter [Neorhodopirellula lusitana]|uniref:DUF1559 family PulG-like putative transporter n=1 Tax=Neorhodopirellula lusitana TaxID=445327 RepID=UPI00384C8839